jgi:hypothetical protein
MPGLGAGDVVLGRFDGLVHGFIEYQVLMTFTKGTVSTLGSEFFTSHFNVLSTQPRS